MKKTLLAAALLLGALTISAQDYTHSIGATVGNMYGVSYKGFIFGVDGLALQADLGVKISNYGKAATITTRVDGNSNTNSGTFANSQDYFTFEVNPNVVYQRDITSGGWGKLSWYAGGGISIGMMKSGASGNFYMDDNGALHDFWWAVSARIDTDGDGSKDADAVDLGGKFGFNAVGGVEMSLAGAPLVIGLDFRPGYGLQFLSQDMMVGMSPTGPVMKKASITTSFFDWTLAASIRYRF